MSYIGKTQLKKWFTEEMKPFFKAHGFQYKSSVNVEVWKETSTCIFSTFISVSSTDDISMYLPRIRNKNVENILWQITGMDVYEKSDTLRIKFQGNRSDLQSTITSKQEIVSLCETFKQVFEQEYLPAFEKYHDPHQVLKLWDSLKTVEEKNNYFFGPDKYIKILILSKICSDTNFENRCKEYLNIYEQLIITNGEAYRSYLSYCEKVIAYLEENVP